MKKNFVKLMMLFTFCGFITLNGFGKKTIFTTRSQGLNGVLELVGWQKIMYSYGENTNYGTVAGSLEYTRSFKPSQIAEFLFGGSSVRFSGSQTERMKGDVLADYFGLPVDFSSTVCISPHVSNVIVDFDWFQGFDAYVPGLFFMLHVPIVHTKWNLYFNETGITPGTAFYPAGYMSNQRIDATVLPHSVTEALEGKTVFGDMQDPLKFGKVFGRQERSRVAEVQATLGYNYKTYWWHVGCSFRVGAPTGNATNAEFLFEEIVGNGHHWDVGGGISAHINVWENAESGRCIALYGDAHISHLCSSTQKRSFDLTKNGMGSRYMLLEQIADSSQGLFVGGNIAANQYIGKLMPAINQTTFNTKISIGVQADVVLKLAYYKDNFECDLGYELWARSAEKMHCRDRFVDDRCALKGDAQLYGFGINTPSSIILLNATESEATIFGGQGNANVTYQNLNVDNHAVATTGIDGTIQLNQLNSADAAALNIAQVPVNGSSPSILLKDTDINNDSGILPRAISNKVFGHVNYIWDNDDDVSPYCGGGASVELAGTDQCNNSGMSQWSVWLKVGLAY